MTLNDMTIELSDYLQSIGISVAYDGAVSEYIITSNHTVAEVLQAIALYVPKMPTLTRRQFLRFLAISNLDSFVKNDLESLRSMNAGFHADVYSQLDGGLTFFWPLTLQFTQMLLQVVPDSPEIDFEELRELWIYHSTHHVQVTPN